MNDRSKIQLLIEEGAVRKVGEEKIFPGEFHGEGVSETFQLTEYGEKKYFTFKNAMEKISWSTTAKNVL